VNRGASPKRTENPEELGPRRKAGGEKEKRGLKEIRNNNPIRGSGPRGGPCRSAAGFAHRKKKKKKKNGRETPERGENFNSLRGYQRERTLGEIS